MVCGLSGRPIMELQNSMNYNYYWLSATHRIEEREACKCPPRLKHFASIDSVYYAFGLRKLKMFHSKKWINCFAIMQRLVKSLRSIVIIGFRYTNPWKFQGNGMIGRPARIPTKSNNQTELTVFVCVCVLVMFE